MRDPIPEHLWFAPVLFFYYKMSLTYAIWNTCRRHGNLQVINPEDD